MRRPPAEADVATYGVAARGQGTNRSSTQAADVNSESGGAESSAPFRQALRPWLRFNFPCTGTARRLDGDTGLVFQLRQFGWATLHSWGAVETPMMKG